VTADMKLFLCGALPVLAAVTASVSFAAIDPVTTATAVLSLTCFGAAPTWMLMAACVLPVEWLWGEVCPEQP
jgi:hypothetical protein